MSRGLSATVKTTLASSNYFLATLIKLEFNTTYYLTNASTTITYSSNDYVSTGLFIKIGDLQDDSAITNSALDVTLTAVSTGIMSDLLTNGYVDRPVTIYLSLMSSDMAIIDAPFEIFQGNVNSMTITEKLGSSILKLKVTNHWAKLDQISGRYLTKESQQRFFNGDLCFDRVSQTGKRLEWGIEKD